MGENPNKWLEVDGKEAQKASDLAYRQDLLYAEARAAGDDAPALETISLRDLPAVVCLKLEEYLKGRDNKLGSGRFQVSSYRAFPLDERGRLYVCPGNLVKSTDGREETVEIELHIQVNPKGVVIDHFLVRPSER